jgi:hypothetical protein
MLWSFPTPGCPRSGLGWTQSGPAGAVCSASPVGVLDVRDELPTESGGVLGVPVHLIGSAADPEPHRLIRATLEIVFEEDGHL